MPKPRRKFAHPRRVTGTRKQVAGLLVAATAKTGVAERRADLIAEAVRRNGPLHRRTLGELAGVSTPSALDMALCLAVNDGRIVRLRPGVYAAA
jgi:hypothetical protein